MSSPHFASSSAVSQGHELALIVAACVGVAALLRGLMTIQIDRRLEDWMPPVFEPRSIAAAIGGAVAVVVAVAIVAGAPSWVSSQYHQFVNGDTVGHHEDPRARLTSAGNNGRVPQWEVAFESFEAQPLHGEGAGTYQLAWARNRPYRFTVIDAHSLYIEVLGEMGVVGFLLIAGTVIAIMVGLARRVRGEERQVYAALLVLGLVWAVHAGVDWDWEMPAVTLWLFALAGLALAKPIGDRMPVAMATFEPGRLVRIVAAICVGVLAVTPAAIAISQSRLDKAVADFRAGDCGATIDASLGSLDALKVRPEPYELIGYCDIRLGQGRLAVLQMRNAVDRDPESWEPHYGLALALASEGRDPMPELETAHRLNPLEETMTEDDRGDARRDPPENAKGGPSRPAFRSDLSRAGRLVVGAAALARTHPQAHRDACAEQSDADDQDRDREEAGEWKRAAAASAGALAVFLRFGFTGAFRPFAGGFFLLAGLRARAVRPFAGGFFLVAGLFRRAGALCLLARFFFFAAGFRDTARSRRCRCWTFPRGRASRRCRS